MFHNSDFDAERRLFKRAERIITAAWVGGCLCLVIALFVGGFLAWKLLIYLGIL